MTRPQSIERIREALEDGPTLSEWVWDDDAIYRGEPIDFNESSPWLCTKSLDKTVLHGEINCDNPADAAFIAACNPSAIKELLTYLEGVERELQAERKRFDWYFSLTDVTVFLPIYFEGVQLGWTPDKWREGLDKAIATAIAKEPKP